MGVTTLLFLLCSAQTPPSLQQVAKDVRKAWAKNYPRERIEKVDSSGPSTVDKGKSRVPLILTVARQNGTMGAYSVTAEYKGAGPKGFSLAVGEVKELPPKSASLPKPTELKALVKAALVASGAAKGQLIGIELGASEFTAEGARQSYRFDGKYAVNADGSKQDCDGMMVMVAREGSKTPWAAEVLTPGTCK